MKCYRVTSKVKRLDDKMLSFCRLLLPFALFCFARLALLVGVVVVVIATEVGVVICQTKTKPERSILFRLLYLLRLCADIKVAVLLVAFDLRRRTKTHTLD